MDVDGGFLAAGPEGIPLPSVLDRRGERPGRQSRIEGPLVREHLGLTVRIQGVEEMARPVLRKERRVPDFHRAERAIRVLLEPEGHLAPRAQEIALAERNASHRVPTDAAEREADLQRPGVLSDDRDIHDAVVGRSGQDRGAPDEAKLAKIPLRFGQQLGIVGISFLEEQEAADDRLVRGRVQRVRRAVGPSSRRFLRRKDVEDLHRDGPDAQRLLGGRRQAQEKKNREPDPDASHTPKRHLEQSPCRGRVMACRVLSREGEGGDGIMLRWALTFLVIGLVAALFGFTGIAGASFAIAKILAFLFLALFLLFLILGMTATSRLSSM